MLNLQNIKFKHKIAALSMIPLLALLIQVSLSVRQQLKDIHASEDIITLADFSVYASAMVHELQKERGGSSLFLSSKGTQFERELNEQRNLTDSKIDDLNQFLNRSDFANMSLAQSLSQAQQQLNQLNQIRNRISGLNISTHEAISYYTALNGQFLEIIAQLPLISSNAQMSTRLAAYASYLKGKERAGIERAVLSSTFANQGFLPGMYQKLITLIAEQHSYQDMFLALAPDDYKQRFNESSLDSVFAEARTMREKSLANDGHGPFDIDPKYWFKTQTAKINILKEIEDFIAQDSIAAARHLKDSASGQMIVHTVASSMIILLSISLAFWVSGNITGSVNRLQETISRIQQNKDLTLRIKVSGQDEIGQVSVAFNHLMEQFQNSIQQVSQSAHDVFSYAESLASNSNHLASSTSNLSNAASSMAAAVEQMSASIEQVANNARNVYSITQQSNDLSTQGSNEIFKIVSEMNVISDVVQQASSRMRELDNQSTEINSIVKVIQEIADQTNLLALNASIEAARAGEQGRGFAVVADEVRSLSARTTNSAQEIAAMIIKMQNLTGEAVNSMQIGVDKVSQEVSSTQSAGESIEKIQQGTQQVNSAVSDISVAISEQSKVSTEIGRQVENVAHMSEQSLAASNHNAETASQMKTLAANLQNVVANFRI